jgi:hypothetical protein
MRSGPVDNLTEALSALSAEELRMFVCDALERLDDVPRADLEDLLVQRAARSASGWKPAAPPAAFVEEAKAFAVTARLAGQAEPFEVDGFLRRAVTASLAGDHSSARVVFEAVLEPIGNGDIFLGQGEMVDEMLSVDLHECLRRFAAAVYMTAPLTDRPQALIDAIASLDGISYLNDPIEEIAAALGGDVPELDAFLPLWISRLEGDATPHSEWESDRDRWLRTAVGRRDGIAGLARMARTTRRPEAARAWCDALVAKGEWSEALVAYEECAALVEHDYTRGAFLDGAALATQVLGRKDLAKKLEAAWLGAPSLLRLVRWLVGGEASTATVRKRAAAALNASPTKAPRIIGFLDLLAGRVGAAAQLLSQAPGLGWSRGEHPGHVLFPAFAWLLGGAPAGSVRADLSLALHAPPRGELHFAGAPDDTDSRFAPKLPSPAPVDVLQRADVMHRLAREDRKVMLDAMKAAATRRADGVLAEKRRGHYGHAARLVACCMELEDGSGKAQGPSSWAEALRARTSRFPAFQEALRAAFARARRGV